MTGAGQGMGRAFAQRLCEAGAVVAAAEVNRDTGQTAAAELSAAGHQAGFYPVDVRDSPTIQTMADDLVARFGHIDILVNNAGVASGGPSEDVTEDEWDRVLGIMLTGVFRCCQIVAGTRAGFMTGQVLRADGGWAALNSAVVGFTFP